MSKRQKNDLKHTKCWIFDLDNTLYPAKCDLFAQMHEKMQEFVEKRLGLDAVSAQQFRSRVSQQYGTTLRGLMSEHDIPPDAFLDFVHDIDLSPVQRNERLNEVLSALPGRKLIFTNATVNHADRVLEKLGIARHFDVVFDIAASAYQPKPVRAPYDQLVAQHMISPATAVMVEDMVQNLAPAADMGMTTVLVPNWHGDESSELDHDHVHHQTDDLTKWLEDLLEG